MKKVTIMSRDLGERINARGKTYEKAVINGLRRMKMFGGNVAIWEKGANINANTYYIRVNDKHVMIVSEILDCGIWVN